MRLAPVMGITRVANVTGLDVVDIPVVMVCRPNSRSVTVSQGKGVDLAVAKASGLMEAAELYHAETLTLPLRLASYEEIRYQHKVIDVNQCPRGSGSRFHPNLRLLWCEGHDLISEEKILVPYEMVHTNFTTPLPDGHGCFTAGSNGLASGNTTVEAISHAICEVIERDATTLWNLRAEGRFEHQRLDLETVDDPLCRQLICKLERAGLLVAVWDITTDIEIAAFACFVLPQNGKEVWHSAVDAGFGCHPLRNIALARALTEAAQTRLTVIAGLRDDFHRDTYDELLDPELIGSLRHRIAGAVATRRFRDTPDWNAQSFEEDVAWELRCLQNAGLRHAVMVDLTKAEFALPVVRVVVPGFEPMLGSDYIPGQRGQSVLAAQL